MSLNREKVRSELIAHSLELCRMSDRATAEAKTAALESVLNEDYHAKHRASSLHAQAESYMSASKHFDGVRMKLERGEFDD